MLMRWRRRAGHGLIRFILAHGAGCYRYVSTAGFTMTPNIVEFVDFSTRSSVSVCSFLFYSLLFYSCLLLFYKTLLFYSSVCPSFLFCSCLVKSSSKIPGSSAWNGFSVPLDLDCTIPPHCCSVEVRIVFTAPRAHNWMMEQMTKHRQQQKTTIN